MLGKVVDINNNYLHLCNEFFSIYEFIVNLNSVNDWSVFQKSIMTKIFVLTFFFFILSVQGIQDWGHVVCPRASVCDGVEKSCTAFNSYIKLIVEVNRGSSSADPQVLYYPFCVRVDKLSQLNLNGSKCFGQLDLIGCEAFEFVSNYVDSYIVIHAPPYKSVQRRFFKPNVSHVCPS
jgi:hypothetical protein